jgi:hypothetical protein
MKKFLAAALAATIALAPGAAIGQSNGSWWRIAWYSDDSMTTLVGEAIYYCDGGQYVWGGPTPYRTDEFNDC